MYKSTFIKPGFLSSIVKQSVLTIQTWTLCVLIGHSEARFKNEPVASINKSKPQI